MHNRTYYAVRGTARALVSLAGITVFVILPHLLVAAVTGPIPT